MDRDARSPNLLSSLVAVSAARRLTVEAGASLRKTKRDEREQHLHVSGPIPWPHEYHALVNAIPMNASSGGQFARVKTGAYASLDINHASLSAAVGVTIGAATTAGGAVAHGGASPSPLQADDLSSFVSTTGGATAAVVETASLLSVAAGNGPGGGSPPTESLTVTPDKADYEPGR